MTDLSNQSPYLSVEQVANRYGVSTDSIWRWKREGRFPAAVSIGRNCTRWRLSDLIEYEGQLESCFATDLMWEPAC